jgi:hypothetical protein
MSSLVSDQKIFSRERFWEVAAKTISVICAISQICDSDKNVRKHNNTPPFRVGVFKTREITPQPISLQGRGLQNTGDSTNNHRKPRNITQLLNTYLIIP